MLKQNSHWNYTSLPPKNAPLLWPRSAELSVQVSIPTFQTHLLSNGPTKNTPVPSHWLVVYLPLWKIWVRQLGWWHSQLNGIINNVPNHQPVSKYIYIDLVWLINIVIIPHKPGSPAYNNSWTRVCFVAQVWDPGMPALVRVQHVSTCSIPNLGFQTLPSGNLLHSYWKLPSRNSGFPLQKWWIFPSFL